MAIHHCNSFGDWFGHGVCHVVVLSLVYSHGRLDGMEAGEFSVLVVWHCEIELGGALVPQEATPRLHHR